jgi:hypothetical protein
VLQKATKDLLVAPDVSKVRHQQETEAVDPELRDAMKSRMNSGVDEISG